MCCVRWGEWKISMEIKESWVFSANNLKDNTKEIEDRLHYENLPITPIDDSKCGIMLSK